MIISKKVKGEVDYNDGEFAEVQNSGIEGIEEDLLLETFQIHRENISCSPEEFCRRFPVGMRLDVVTTTEITPELDLDNLGESGTGTDNNAICNSGDSVLCIR
jgi:hypothetical protein